METQDHKKPNLTGSDGQHGGGSGHLCHKCGWPFPNPHPSSKNRRAHKRVCGTIEGYRLDNDAESKNLVEGDPHSDDELKTPSEKVAERTVSRRSSSGVGSRSDRSIRSEDEFTDAVTEFNESPAGIVREASDGALQRYYSLQNDNGLDGTKPAEENSVAVADNLSSPDHLKGNQLQAVESVKGEKHKLEAGMSSQDHTFTSPLVSTAVASESKNAVDQDMILSSELSRELDIVSDIGKDVLFCKDELDLRSGTPEEVTEEVSGANGGGAEVKGVTDELLDSVSADGLMKVPLAETDGVEDSNEWLNNADFPEKEETESCKDVSSPGNIYSPSLQIQDTDSRESNGRKSDLIEEWDSKIGANEAVCVLPVPDVLPSQQHPEIAVENLDHEGGKFNFSNATESMAENVEYIKACVVDDGGLDTNKTDDNDRLLSEDFDFCSMVDKPEDSKMPVDEQNTFGEQDQLSSAVSSNANINILGSEVAKDLKTQISEDNKESCAAEKKSITSPENIIPEGVTMNAGQIQETTSNGDFNGKEDGGCSTTLDSECGEHSENDFAARTSMLAKPAIDEVASQDLELLNSRNNSSMSNVDDITVEADLLNGGEISGEVLENLSNEMEPAQGLSLGGSYDSPHDSKETVRNADIGVLNKISDSADMMSAHSQGESLLTSQCSGKTESTGETARKEQCVDDMGIGAVLLDGDHLKTTSRLEVMHGDAESSLQSSAAVDHCTSEKLTENTSCIAEGNGVLKKDVSIPAIDTVVDSGSQTDSLDGNWGSVSVMSTTSDAQLTADTVALSHPRALEGEESPSMVPKPAMENQHSDSQIYSKLEVGIKEMERVSEIQTSNEQQHINSALQTGRTPTIGHVANEPDRGKKDKEILAKVTNWDSGKQHSTPLKTLLGEATARSRAESPIHHNQSSSSTPMPKTDVVPGTNNGFSAKTENAMVNSSNPEMETAQEEMGKEWNSPARYPVNIKTEKRRTKSRPLWAPFLCCSSVNAR